MAVIVTSVLAVTAEGAKSLNALVCPDSGMFTERGRETMAGLLLESIIVAPSVGAPEAKLTVKRTPTLLPPTTVDGESVTEEIGIFCAGALTVSVALLVAPPKLALILTGVVRPVVFVWIGKLAFDCPAGMVTLAGVETRFGLSFVSVTNAPPAGATYPATKLTTPVPSFPP